MRKHEEATKHQPGIALNELLSSASMKRLGAAMTSSDTLPLNEDQQALQDTLRGFLAGQLPAAALRAALETRTGYSPELHARLASEFGLTGLTIPREFGGRGLSQVEASVMHSAIGRVLYPGPLLATALGGGVLLATGDRVARERVLAVLAARSV